LSKRLFSIPVILLLGLILAILLSGIIRLYIVTPFAKLIYHSRYLLNVALESMDQALFWVSLVTICMVFSLTSVVKFISTKEDSTTIKESSHGDIQIWLKRLRSTSKGDYFKWRLSQDLGEMTLEIIGSSLGLTLEETRNRLISDKLDLPLSVNRYLQAANKTKIHGFYSTYRDIDRDRSPLNINPEDIIAFLEDRIV
jgi:hypothetical protein